MVIQQSFACDHCGHYRDFSCCFIAGVVLLDVSIMFSSFRQKLLSVAEVNPLKILSFLVCSVFFSLQHFALRMRLQSILNNVAAKLAIDK